MQIKSTSIFAILAVGVIAGLLSAVLVNSASALRCLFCSGDRTGGLTGQVGELLRNAGDSVNDAKRSAGDALSNTGDTVKGTLRELGPALGSVLGCNPLDPRGC